MFGLFGITRDANKAHAYLVNFVSFASDSIALFGFERAATLISESEWATGPRKRVERSFSYFHFRLCIPFSSFSCTLDNEISGSNPSLNNGKITIEAADSFCGFGLFNYTDRQLTQVYAINSPIGPATARACMLMSRFKAKGATDITRVLMGKF